MGHKGSLKNRIRSWKYFRKLKKEKKKQEEQEALKQLIESKKSQGIYIQPVTKKYNIIQRFFHAFFGLFVGIFETKKTESINSPSKLLQEIIQLQQEVIEDKNPNIAPSYYSKLKQIENALEQYQNEKHSNTILNECTKRIDTTKKQLNSKVSVDNVLIKEEKEQSDSKINSIDNISMNIPIEMFEQLESEKQKKVISDEKLNTTLEKPNHVTDYLEEQPKVSLSDSSKKKIEDKNEQKIDAPKQELDKFQKYLMDANKKLKKAQEELTKAKEKVKKATNGSSLYQIESSILWIQNQLILMKKEYAEISNKKEFQYLKNQYEYYYLDAKDLLKNDSAIQILLDSCQKEIDDIERLAKQPIKEIKKERQKEQKEEKKEKQQFYLDIEDFELLRSQIMMDLNRQIEELNQMIPMIKQPTTFFGKVKKFLSNTMFILTPTVFFKNKLAGMLTSSILVHNRVRSMHQMINQKEAIYETGEHLFAEIRNKQDCLYAISAHLNASLAELQQMKQEFIMQYQHLYPTEVEAILSQFDLLENQILSKNMELQMGQQKLTKVKQKYQKVLKK